jgi:hypothetical protein
MAATSWSAVLCLRGAPLLILMIGFAAAAAGQTNNQAPANNTNPKPVHTPGIKIGVPKPSPQQIPESSVLPAGTEAGTGTYPANYSEDIPAQGNESRRGEFVIAPIPFSNEAITFGLIPVVDYLFHPNPADKDSPPSSLILAGMIATRSSWALGGGASLYLKHDRFRIQTFAGHGTVGYDIFGVGTASGDLGQKIPIRQGGDLAMFEVLVRLKGKLYLGPRFNYRKLSAMLGLDESNASLPGGLSPDDLGSEFASHAFGLKVLLDTRTDVFYPVGGHKVQFIADFFHGTRTSANLPEKSLNYQNYEIAYNQYHSLTSSQVLAFRAMSCVVNGDPPFYELCQFGSSSDLRGYQPGRFRDRLMFAVQAEYRQVLSPRWGFVFFGGVGEVAHTWNSFTAGNLLPAGGTGVRFNLSKKQRVNMRADIAYGKTGLSWNFSLGEAF